MKKILFLNKLTTKWSIQTYIIFIISNIQFQIERYTALKMYVHTWEIQKKLFINTKLFSWWYQNATFNVTRNYERTEAESSREPGDIPALSLLSTPI